MLPETGLTLDCIYAIAKHSSGPALESLQATCDEVFDVIEKRIHVMSYELVVPIDSYVHWRVEQFQVTAESEHLRLHMLNRKIRARYNGNVRDLHIKFFRLCPQSPERNMVVGFTKFLQEHRAFPFDENIVGVIITGAEACGFSQQVQ